MNFNLISKKRRVCVLSGKSVLLIVSIKQEFIKKPPRHKTASRRNPTRVDESLGLRCRVRAAASLFTFFVAQDRKLSLSGGLGLAEEALKRHYLRNSSGHVAIEGFSVSSSFLARLLGVRD